jgi:hypothetical protein
MEFVPFGQDGIPPTAGKATKYPMLYNSLESVYIKGIEAFNLLLNLLILKEQRRSWFAQRFFQVANHDRL